MCPGDADGDLRIAFSDITTVLQYWGASYSITTGIGDANGDGIVGFDDIMPVLMYFNTQCP